MEKFPEIKCVCMRTVCRAVTIKLNYSYTKISYLNPDKNSERIRIYRYYYMKKLFQYINGMKKVRLMYQRREILTLMNH